MGSHLSEEKLNEYLETMTADQRDGVLALRPLLLASDPSLSEEIDQGKWFGGLLTYNAACGMTLFALGPRAGGKTTFHMAPYYGSVELQTRHGAALKKLMTGKSCLAFKRVEDVPMDALTDIVTTSAGPMRKTMEEMWQKRSRK